MEAFLGATRELSEQILQLEAVIEQAAMDRKDPQLLMTIPGVSYFSSMLILVEIGDITQLDRAAGLVSSAGLDPVVRESGDTHHEGGITKQGRAAPIWIFVHCTIVAVGRADDPYLGSFYCRLKRKENYQIAIIDTARKMLVSIFHMLDREELYDPLDVTA